MANADEMKKINEKYNEKKSEIEKKISLEFDAVLNKIYSKYEQDYRDMGLAKKEKRDLNGRISELKSILKIFNKELSILTKNKKKVLKEKLSELKKEKEEHIKRIKNKTI